MIVGARLCNKKVLASDPIVLEVRNLKKTFRVKQGLFREDLFHRLNVIRLRIPPLRERRSDLPQLAASILARLARTHGRPTPLLAPSALFIIESQMNYILDCIRTVRAKGLRSIEVRRDAERTYTAMIHREMERTVWKSGGCHSWYQSKSGHVIAMFPGFSFTYRQLANRFKPEHHVFS